MSALARFLHDWPIWCLVHKCTRTSHRNLQSQQPRAQEQASALGLALNCIHSAKGKLYRTELSPGWCIGSHLAAPWYGDMGSHKSGRSNGPHLLSCVQDCKIAVNGSPSTMHTPACTYPNARQQRPGFPRKHRIYFFVRCGAIPAQEIVKCSESVSADLQLQVPLILCVFGRSLAHALE